MQFRAADFVRVLKDGYALADAIAERGECSRLADSITRYAAENPLPLIERACGGRDLRYSVIDGETIAASLPGVAELYDDMRRTLSAAVGRDIVPLADARAAVNVNITAPGGEYRWHYDRNPLTAIVYLTSIEGGDIELHPLYRILLGRLRHTRLQRILDRILLLFRALAGRSIVVAPTDGRVVAMNGDRCLHSVRCVESGTRIALVFAYDFAGACSSVASELDRYLYTRETTAIRDPNYAG